MSTSDFEPLINKYFREEKQESFLFMIVAIAAIIISIFLLRSNSYWKGAAYPLIAIALIQAVVGSTVYFRTDKQMEALVTQLRTNPAQYKSEETTRMERIMKNFTIFRYIEMALMIIGIYLFLQFSNGSLWYAAGIGLTIQAGLMLLADLFAEDRAKQYITQLKELTVS